MLGYLDDRLDDDEPDERDSTAPDPWLLPRTQAEYPGRAAVPEPVLHARREKTFAMLAMLALASCALLVVVQDPVIDVQLVLAQVARDLELTVRLFVPLGAVTTALGLATLMLACELYGRRRARSLVTAGALACAVFVAFAYLADIVDPRAERLVSTLASAACWFAANLVTLLVFDVLRRRLGGRALIVRAVATALVAAAVGWSAYAGVAHALTDAPDATAFTAIALGGGLVTVAGAFALAALLALAADTLCVYLRVARRPTIDAGLGIEDDDYRAGPVERFEIG